MTNWFASTQRGVVVLAFACLTPNAIAQEPAVKSPSPTKSTKATPVATPPDWARDAKWYYMVVPQFRNDDTSNDPPIVKPWTSTPKTNSSTGHYKLGHYGGDLVGLQSKLPYLQALGINTICVTSLFKSVFEHNLGPSVWGHEPSNLRHIDDYVGVKNSLSKVSGETDDPKTWKFSASDSLFHRFIKIAHDARMRVVLGVFVNGSVPEAAREATLRRWMDPNGDGNPADGIDGWLISDPDNSQDLQKSWQKTIKSINPRAITVANQGSHADHHFDVQTSTASGSILLRLGSLQSGTRNSVTGFHAPSYDHFRTLNALLPKNDLASCGSLLVLSDRLVGTLGSSPSTYVSEEFRQDSTRSLATLRLAIIIHHFLPGVPMTIYGEEVGMYGFKDDNSLVPMWWNDLPGKETKAKDYREDLQSLVQWLHLRRDIDEPLRYGELRTVIADNDRKIVVLARTMPKKEIILVMNCSDEKQKVMVPVGHPREMVALLTPHLTSGPRARKMPAGPGGIRPLPMGGNKQLVNHEGKVRVWIEPMTVRYVLHEAP